MTTCCVRQFYEELLDGIESKVEQSQLPKKPANKIIKFPDSDSSSSDNDDDDAEDNNDIQTKEDKSKDVIAAGDESALEVKDGESVEKQTQEKEEKKPENLENQEGKEEKKPETHDNLETEPVEPLVKKRRVEVDAFKSGNLSTKVEDKSVDKLIEAELAELGDRGKVSPKISL